ncbi:hypothetical protein AB9F39_35140, partial [Rhizobium leguminosarum]
QGLALYKKVYGPAGQQLITDQTAMTELFIMCPLNGADIDQAYSVALAVKLVDQCGMARNPNSFAVAYRARNRRKQGVKAGVRLFSRPRHKRLVLTSIRL